jgi:hypothetical protein
MHRAILGAPAAPDAHLLSDLGLHQLRRHRSHRRAQRRHLHVGSTASALSPAGRSRHAARWVGLPARAVGLIRPGIALSRLDPRRLPAPARGRPTLVTGRRQQPRLAPRPGRPLDGRCRTRPPLTSDTLARLRRNAAVEMGTRRTGQRDTHTASLPAVAIGEAAAQSDVRIAFRPPPASPHRCLGTCSAPKAGRGGAGFASTSKSQCRRCLVRARDDDHGPQGETPASWKRNRPGAPLGAPARC